MKPCDTILTAIDFSENSEYAFDYALTLAKQFQADLHVLHVINEPLDLRNLYFPHISFQELKKEIEAGAADMMEGFCHRKMGGYAKYQTCIVNGLPYEEIIRKASEINASLIVVGTRGRTGLDHVIFGSTAGRVVRGAPCPVLSVRLPSEFDKK